MSLRHRSIFNGASMAQDILRHRYRRPKENPMAHWLRLWFSTEGAPTARRRATGTKIQTRRRSQIAAQALNANRQGLFVVLRVLLAEETAKRAA
jgi:hypothetical protein